MKDNVAKNVACRLRKALLSLGAICASFLISDAYAGDLRENESDKLSQSQTEHISAANDRKAAVEAFKKKLEEAKTPAERRIAIEEFRSKSAANFEARSSTMAEQKRAEINFAKLKSNAQGNPEMLARVEVMEVRLRSVKAIKSKLAEAQVATGEEKQRLLEDVRREQSKLAQVQQQAMQSRLEEAKAQSVESTKDLPLEMAAMKAKSDARRQELDQLREALTKASPQERVKLLDAWREKRMQERAELPARTPSAQ